MPVEFGRSLKPGGANTGRLCAAIGEPDAQEGTPSCRCCGRHQLQCSSPRSHSPGRPWVARWLSSLTIVLGTEILGGGALARGAIEPTRAVLEGGLVEVGPKAIQHTPLDDTLGIGCS